jgi:hypothetical protein
VANNCTVCNKEYSPLCDYKQGRCPHHPPMINIQPKDTSKGHFYVSLAKSGLRIIAGIYLFMGNFVVAGLLLIAAEVLGILEEIV